MNIFHLVNLSSIINMRVLFVWLPGIWVFRLDKGKDKSLTKEDEEISLKINSKLF